ncbi:MAG: MotA/TolQ/ExbB proton channel family protein [Phycisphaerales bacterium]|nr:MotA/TolQ/ExbB proton channel family protein [Phycisphaerales bacterium]
MGEFFGDFGMLLNRGGYVMIPLLLLSICSVTLIIERAIFWVAVNGRASLQRLAEMNAALRKGDNERVQKLLVTDRTPYGRVAKRLIDDGASDAVALEAVDGERRKFNRYMIVMSTIITASPLLGILGTVIGIIQSFELLGGTSTLTDPRDVAGGIAAALLTTAFGLIVALITLFPYMVFKGQSAHAVDRLETMIASTQEGYKAVQKVAVHVGVGDPE